MWCSHQLVILEQLVKSTLAAVSPPSQAQLCHQGDGEGKSVPTGHLGLCPEQCWTSTSSLATRSVKSAPGEESLQVVSRDSRLVNKKLGSRCLKLLGHWAPGPVHLFHVTGYFGGINSEQKSQGDIWRAFFISLAMKSSSFFFPGLKVPGRGTWLLYFYLFISVLQWTELSCW